MADSHSSLPQGGGFSVRSNIAANILANVLIAAIFFASVPLIIRYLGVEGYGLVALFLIAQGLASVIDLGLGTVLTREFAVLTSDKNDNVGASRDLLRTSEVFYWSAAVAVCAGWTIFAGPLSGFVNPNGLDGETLYNCFLLMGGAIALQLPFGLYSGALYGLHRQALVSGIGVIFSFLRNLGGVAVLHFLSPAPEAFFVWQLICFAFHVPILGLLVRSALPKAVQPPSFRHELLTTKWRFVTGVGLITLTTMGLMYIDRFVLARVISLESFGYYAIAGVVANGLHWLTQPIFRGLLPRLSQLTKEEDRPALSLLYHQGTQLLAIVVFPAGALWALFAYELLLIWQQDPQIAANSSAYVTLLIAAGALNAVSFMPYALQLAFGWTRLQLTAVVGALTVSVPLTVFAALYWGGIGAAAVGLALNVAIVTFVVPQMHRRLLTGEAFSWFTKDILLPLGAVVIVGSLGRLVLAETSMALTVVQLGILWACMTGAAILSSSLARAWLRNRFTSHARSTDQ